MGKGDYFIRDYCVLIVVFRIRSLFQQCPQLTKKEKQIFEENKGRGFTGAS